MNIEELKLIIEAVNQTTGDAKDIAIAYLVVILFEPIIVASAIVAIVAMGCRALKPVFDSLTEDSFARQLRGITDPHSNWGPLMSDEKRRIISTLKRGMGDTEK